MRYVKMMQDMMKKCCGEDGLPDFEKMKQFCSEKIMPAMQEIMEMMKKCGCKVSESSDESKSECCH